MLASSQRRRAARVGNRDHDVDVLRLGNAADLVRRARSPMLQARLVDRRAVDHRVGPREVDELEDARDRAAGCRRTGARGTCRSGRRRSPRPARRRAALESPAPRARPIRCATTYSVPPIASLHADDQRPDAVRIAEREQAVAGDHRDDRVRAAAAPVHAGDRGEDRVRRRAGDAARRARARAPAR